MKVDVLFLERGCSHCGVIKTYLNLEAIADDDFRGKDGQEFFVFSSQSNAASKYLLGKFGIGGRAVPILVTHDGAILGKIRDIAAHLVGQGMSSK